MYYTDRKTTLLEKAVIVMVLLVVACIVVPKATNSIENAVWSEARNMASDIRQNARLFSQNKPQNWKHWETVTIYELGYSYKDLDGTYFKHDSYSIKFFSRNDFLIKITVTDTTKGAAYFNKYLLTLDEKGNWGFIDKPK